MSYVVLEKHDGSGYIVVEMLSGQSPAELEKEHCASYKISFRTKEQAEDHRDKLSKASTPRWV